MKVYTVAFFGHRHIDNIPEIERFLERYFKCLLDEKEYVEFLVGRNGEFDQCVASTVRKVKKEYRDDNSRLVLMLPYVTAEYKKNQSSFENYYDYIEICREAAESHPKAAIEIRNRKMVDRADFIISFVKERGGGAYRALVYALAKNKDTVNLKNFIKYIL